MNNNDSAAKQSKLSPGRAFLTGMVSGILILLSGFALAFLQDQRELLVSAWLLPLLSAPVAAGGAAYKLGSSLGRIVSLAVLALFWAAFILGVGEYVALYDATVGSVFSNDGWPDMQGIFWRWQLVLSILATTVGALLGLMFGKSKSE